jgi:hypothetical protein
LSNEDAGRLGEDGGACQDLRLIVLVAQELRTLMDQLLRADGLTTQQAALITVVDLLGIPSLSQAATAPHSAGRPQDRTRSPAPGPGLRRPPAPQGSFRSAKHTDELICARLAIMPFESRTARSGGSGQRRRGSD